MTSALPGLVQDDLDMNLLSMTGRNALWQKLMPARAGSAQDAAERMKGLKPPDSKRPDDHKHLGGGI